MLIRLIVSTTGRNGTNVPRLISKKKGVKQAWDNRQADIERRQQGRLPRDSKSLPLGILAYVLEETERPQR